MSKLKIIDIETEQSVNEFDLESTVYSGYGRLSLLKDSTRKYIPTKTKKEDSKITLKMSKKNVGAKQYLVHQELPPVVLTGKNLDNIQIYVSVDKQGAEAGYSVARVLLYNSEGELMNSDCYATAHTYGYGSTLGNVTDVLKPNAKLGNVAFRSPYYARNAVWACLSGGTRSGTKHTASLFVRPRSGKTVKVKRLEIYFGTNINPVNVDYANMYVYFNGSKIYTHKVGHHSGWQGTPGACKKTY